MSEEASHMVIRSIEASNVELRGSGLLDAEDSLKCLFDSSEIELGPQLGQGTYGVVYRGSLRGKAVAVKKLKTQQLSAEQMSQFKMEVAIMTKLRHPNVLLFMGAVVDPENLMIVTELMPRGSVQSILRDSKLSKELNFSKRMKMAKDAALGMNWLHLSKPVFIHRDLKTANLLVNESGVVKIADFGISLAKNAGETLQFGSIGTPLWMAPEMLLNQEYNESVDVYSFGLVLYEIFTGIEPFSEVQNLEELIEAVCVANRRPELPQSLPKSLCDLISECWSAFSSRRPTFSQIIERLDEILLEGMLRDRTAISFWRKSFRNEEKVNSTLFIRKFLSFCRLKAGQDDPQLPPALCLKELLDRNGFVTLESLHDWLQYFGPLQANASAIQEMTDLLSQEWFHGDVATPLAEQLLAARPEGTFMLRFSSQSGSYTLSCRQGGRVKHYRIARRGPQHYCVGNNTVANLHQLVAQYAAEIGLQHALPGSKYLKCFAAVKGAAVTENGNTYIDDLKDITLFSQSPSN